MLPGVITQFEAHVGTLSTLYGIDITGNVSANVKGTSYTTIAAATGFACDGFFFQFNRATLARKFLADLAIGPASSEVNIISNYLAQTGDDTTGSTGLVDIPIAIPAGTRISGRVQGNVGSAVLNFAVYPYKKDGSNSRFTAVTTYGATTGTSSGVLIDPGATINTKPATFTQITAATTGAVRGIIVRVGFQANQLPQFAHWRADIATGGSGSETVIFGDLLFQSFGNVGDMFLPGQWVFPVAIPAGTRLSARAQCSLNDATDRRFDMEIIGLEGIAIPGAGSYVGSQGLVVV